MSHEYLLKLLIISLRCTTAPYTSPSSFQDCHTNAAALSHNPRNHTLGIIGLGNVGFEIARKAYVAFRMKIVYYDVVRKKPGQEAEIAAEFEPTLEGLLARSDCVVLATPASPDGKKVITKDCLGKMKKGSRFVNIARGSLVDEEAVADAVEAGTLVGVALDVHENEPKVNERLKGLRQVMLTAHNAGGTLDTYAYSFPFLSRFQKISRGMLWNQRSSADRVH